MILQIRDDRHLASNPQYAQAAQGSKARVLIGDGVCAIDDEPYVVAEINLFRIRLEPERNVRLPSVTIHL